MVKLILNWLGMVPSIENALAAFTNAAAELDMVQAHKLEEAEEHNDAARALCLRATEERLAANECATEADRAEALRKQIDRLIKV